jgi:iron complex outermembrane recepter protein
MGESRLSSPRLWFACVAAIGPAAASAACDGDELAEPQEVTVTAMRRAEPLERVPLAVSVLSGSGLAGHNLNDLEDVSAVVPTVDFRTGASNKDQDIFVRGIGTITTSPGVEPAVSTVIDGVVLARPGQATLDLLDLERIEVLRGPQGTLFGKNASAGVVNIVTRDPQASTEGYVDVSYFGGGDEYRLLAGGSGTLLPEQLLGSISALYSRYGGNVANFDDGETVNGYARYGTHVKLLLLAIDDLRLTFNADYMHSTDTVPTGVPASTSQAAYPTGTVTTNPAFASALALSDITASASNTIVSQNVRSNVRDENGGISFVAEYAWSGFTLTSITAWRGWRNVQIQDYDQISQLSAAIPAVADQGELSFHQVSQEARIASPGGSLIEYQAGIYYLQGVDSESYHRQVEQLVGAAQELNSGTAVFGTRSSNFSVFGEGSVQILPHLRALLGARAVDNTLSYEFERVSTSPQAIPAVLPSFASSGSTSARGYASLAGLQYEIDRDLNAYATYSRGYSGPAYDIFFNMSAPETTALQPETSRSYELGLKSRMLERRLQANVAFFQTDFDNYKANFPEAVEGALVTNLINAGTVSTRGVELDLSYQPLDRLKISGAGAATRARVDHFNCPEQAGLSCEINGQPLPFAPDWKLVVGGSYWVASRGPLRWVLDTDYRWQSSVQYQLTETPDTIQGAYGIWNAGISLVDDSRAWSVRASLNNITDTHYSEYLAHGDFAGVMRWVPRDARRYAGVNIRKSF